MNRETDERIRLKGHGYGRELGVNPSFDGIRPKTRVDNRAVYDETSVGSFGAASEKITTMSQRHIEFGIIPSATPVRQTIVAGAGSVTGISFSLVANGSTRYIIELRDKRENTRIHQFTVGTSTTNDDIGDNYTATFGDWGISFNDLEVIAWALYGSESTALGYQGGTVTIANTE